MPVPGLAGRLLLVSHHWDHCWQQGCQMQQEHGPHTSWRASPPLPLCTAGSTGLLRIDANDISFKKSASTGQLIYSPAETPVLTSAQIFQWMVSSKLSNKGFLNHTDVGPLSKKKTAAKGPLSRYRLEAELRTTNQWLHSREAEQGAPCRTQGKRTKARASSLGAAKAGCSPRAGKSEAKGAP